MYACLFLSKAIDYSEVIILNIAKTNDKPGVSFGGRFYEGCVEDSLPTALLEFNCIIENCADMKSQLRFIKD